MPSCLPIRRPPARRPSRVTGRTRPRRILFSRNFELADLLYDEQEAIEITQASERSIEFTRTNRSSGCTVEHRCDVDGDRMRCRLRATCREKGTQALLWEGEERYARRASCERTQSRPEAQGIPSICR